ncbi:reverse transcriptase family protein [Aquabacterium sp.]|uniref:reverse transcriptase family protein n=1 Tax=Aquabacterium sp. TaxID=1872578 RepID=UPI002B85200D|nr:reverse transcriptase family protein [Aquabacterium sp.]HSW03033.1 reverse transcriptase family protein [Aquabacterium sp.]
MQQQLSYREWIARGLAHALLADRDAPGATALHALRARAAAALGEQPAWLPGLIEAIGAGAVQRLDLHTLTAHVLQLPAFHAVFELATPRIRRLILRPAQMATRPLGLHEAVLPSLATHTDLADFLGLRTDRLDWLAGEAQHYRGPVDGRRSATQHYHPQLQPKRQGGLRLIEAPKAELKLAQRRLLDGLLHAVPVHEAATAYAPGRSVRAHAAAHTGQAVLVRFDLTDFFPSIRASRVHALWRTLGYPAGVARTLTTLCTTRTPPAVRARLREAGAIDWLGAKRLAAAHLPQGAPTSPALANLCCFRLDLRLDGLAHAFDARYTRYADDIVFSGSALLRDRLVSLSSWVAGIAADEGFVLHPRKTRCLPQHRQQRITGVVVNRHTNLPREDFDRLKACLHRCLQHGPPDDAQRAELRGRIAWATQLNPARGAKLQAMFERIAWPAPAAPP